MRIFQHPILEFKRGRKVKIVFEGREIEAYEGETIAMALWAAGIKVFSYSKVFHRPRGLFCGIGKCSACLMIVNGIPNVRTCITPVEDGMVIQRQKGEGKLPLKELGEYRVRFAKEIVDVDIAIIGSGPAGLSAALEAAKLGASVAIIDQNPKLGGQLIKQTHKFFGSAETFAGVRGFEIAKILLSELKDYDNVMFYPQTIALGRFREGYLALVKTETMFKRRLIIMKPKAIIVATGAIERPLMFENNDLPGVMTAGAAQTIMNVYGIKPAERVLIVGAGNVGLILAYQFLQANVDVAGLLVRGDRVGGYLVHAAKIRRMGVPIYTRHTIVAAYGKDHVEAATIIRVDERKKPIPGTEITIKDIDGIVIATGMTPDVELLKQMGAKLKYVRELGGFVPLRTRYNETTLKRVFIAGDVGGVEEASTAIMEGRIAGISAAFSIGYYSDKAEKERRFAEEWLEEFRRSPYYAKIREGRKKVIIPT
ncbi:MAG: sarcosine oxidase subunit alpha [Desulfurococcales archaeon ex4484_217_2]|nr:MAG: sarcosine oxidase subunit alpha [Desulfurococcales archaeon ex4484_217_2]